MTPTSGILELLYFQNILKCRAAQRGRSRRCGVGTPGSMGRIVVAGGAGFIGTSLARHLDGLGAEVVVLSRRVTEAGRGGRRVAWDGRSIGAWVGVLEGSSGLVNLCGRSVDCIKTPEHNDEILRSRVESTRVLGVAMRGLARPPPVWVQMSTAHLYGEPGALVCDEGSGIGFGLAPTVGRAWEEAFREGLPPSVRGVVLRTSFVLGRANEGGGGALRTLARLARLGLGGTVGNGRQGISWIHERDMVRLIARALTCRAMDGAYVATAPGPVSNREFMRELRRAVGVPFGLPTPAWLVRLGARLVLRTDPELALLGRSCISRRLEEEGFEFEFPSLRGALADLCAPG